VDAMGIAVDDLGQVHVTGRASSTVVGFPTTTNAYDPGPVEGGDAFVTKLNAAGNDLVFSTLLGGSSFERAYGAALDRFGNVYVLGATFSSDFPTSAGAFDTTYNGERDCFITKFDPTGRSVDYSTYLGGSFSEGPMSGSNSDFRGSIAVDSVGNAYVSHSTLSPDFPTIPGAFDETFNDTNGQANGFIAKLNFSGSDLVYSTFIGGSTWDELRGLALDVEGNTYVTGRTNSSNFPVTPESFSTSIPYAYATFVTKLNTEGNALAYSTFLGPGDGKSVAVDEMGQATSVRL